MKVKENHVLYDPVAPEGRVRGLRSALAPALLGPGEYQSISGLRWLDGRFTTRGGTNLLISLPTTLTGAAIVDCWCGELNQTSYIAAAFLLNSKIEIWASQAGGSMFRLSEVGGFHGGSTGDTRFATSTGRVVFTPIRLQRGLEAGTEVPSKDVLLISNGTDANFVWNPGASVVATILITAAADSGGVLEITTASAHNLNSGDTIYITGGTGNTAVNGSFWITKTAATTAKLYYNEARTSGVVSNGTYDANTASITNNHRFTQHKKLTVPASANTARAYATFNNYWNVAASSGKTFFTAGVVNSADYLLRASTLSPYAAGANTCVEANVLAGAALSDIMAVQFADAIYLGEGLCVFTEDTSSTTDAARQHFMSCKIEMGTFNGAYDHASQNWVTIYDPTSSNEYLKAAFTVNVDYDTVTGTPRYMFVFPTDHLAVASRTGYLLRMTRTGSVPSANYQFQILAMCGMGAFAGGTEFTIAYEDRKSFALSAGYVAIAAGGVDIAKVGGPAETTPTPIKVPISSSVKYDYALSVANATGAVGGAFAAGGLNGEPSHFNIYTRAPSRQTGELDARAYYNYSVSLYSAGTSGGSKGWTPDVTTSMVSHLTSSVTESYATAVIRDFNNPAPSDFQIQIPPHNAAVFANNRLLIGDIYNTTSSSRESGDLYGSAWMLPFQMQSVVEDSRSGFRNQYAGETIKAFVAAAAGGSGSSFIYMLTDRTFKALGGGGALLGSGFDTEELSVAFSLASRGTNSPRSVAEHNGAVYWLDQYGQFQRFANGSLDNISLLTVDDKPRNVPAAMRPYISAGYWKDTVIWAYAEPSGTTNTRVMGFNTVIGAWEFDEPPPVTAERIATWYDSTQSGSGQRLLLWDSTGAFYEYDVDGDDDLGDDIPIGLTFREFVAPGDDSYAIAGVWIAGTAQNTSLTLMRTYRHPTGVSHSNVSLANGRVWDNAKTVVDSGFSDGRGERGEGVYLTVTGTLEPGSVIDHIGCEIVVAATNEAQAG